MPGPTRLNPPCRHGPAPTRRGTHRIFIGMAAGVGKTYRALHELRERLERGEDALIPDDPLLPEAARPPKMLDNFNRLVTDRDAGLFVSLLHISIRAFLFTNRTLAEHRTPDFLKKDYRQIPQHLGSYCEIL